MVRLVFPTIAGSFIAVVVAITVISGLGYYYHKNHNAGVLKDITQASDELYYLGLLFTLVSLSCALFSLFIIEPDTADLERRTNDLIGSFGIALGSTIVGILARILLQRMHALPSSVVGPPLGEPDIFDVSGAANELLKLRQNMREASDAFTHFKRTTLNQAEQTAAHSEHLIREFNARMRRDIENSLAETAESWRNSTQDISAQSQRALESLKALIQPVFDRTENNLQKLDSRVETTARNIEALLDANVDALKKLPEPVDAASRSLKSLASNLEVAEQQTGRLGSAATNAASRITDGSFRIASAFEKSGEGVDQLQSVIQNMGKEVEGAGTKMLEQMVALNHSLTVVSANLNTAGQHTGQIGENFDKVITELDEQTSQIIAAYEAINQGVQYQAELHRNISGLRASIEALTDYVRGLIESLNRRKSRFTWFRRFRKN